MYDQTNMDLTDEVFEVDKILDAKRKDGKLYFKVHWEGYGSEEDSWEPSDNLLSCQELIEKYWLEREKGILKKHGRKSKRPNERSETGESDTDDSSQKERDPEGMMSTLPTKRKRGRPPKQRSSLKPETERMVEKQTLDERNSVSTDSDGTTGSGKKKRGRPPKKLDCEDNESSSLRLSSTDCLLLDVNEIAPLGLTRQASKELALVSLRKKHESDSFTSRGSEVRRASEDTVSDVNPQTSYDSSEKGKKDNESLSCASLENDHFEIIEISSQSTVDDGDSQGSSQDSQVSEKEYIVISSHSESDGEQERSPADSTVKARNILRKGKDTDQKHSLMAAEGEIKSKPDGAGILSEPKEFANIDDINSSSISSSSFVEPSETGVLHVEENKQSPFQSNQSSKEVSLESTEKGSEQRTNENSNQVKSSGKTPSKMLLKLQELSKSVNVSKEILKCPSSGVLNSENEPLVKQTNNENNLHRTAADCLPLKKNFVNRQTNTAHLRAKPSTSKSKQFKDSDGIYSLTDKTASRRDPGQRGDSARIEVNQMDKPHIYNQHPELKQPKERKIKAKARRTGDLCKFKKLITNVTQEGSKSSANTLARRSSPGRNSDLLSGPMSDAHEKFVGPTTADLLPIQNKFISPSLMDGDLIGSIIQDSGPEDHKSKASTKDRTSGDSRPGYKTQDGSDEFRHWDSGMEDISEGEDDLSDFEFDLDDYSPHSFFNDVEEISVPKTVPSPVVEPQEISSADLKQSIREGNDMTVRRAVAVPGFDLEAVDSVSGMTLLMLAAASGQDAVVRLLLRRGAKLNTAQRGNAMTSLMHASEQGFQGTVQILLESGAYINQQQTAGETALMKACKKGHVEVVEVLLKHGVDTRVQSNFDHTAAQFALRSQHYEIHNMLQEHEKSLTSTLEVALAKCLGGAGTLRPPLLMPYRCVAPGEAEKVCFPFKCNMSKVPQGWRVVLFCVKADFNGDEVCLSFGGDNGVRSVLLNGAIQCPVVQGKRSVYLLSPQSESNVLTVATYCVKSRLIVCVANVSTAATDS